MHPFLTFRASIDEHGDKKCLGTRNLISEEDEIQPNGRIFKKAIYGDYSWLTYNEMHDYVKRMSSGLKALGVETKQNVIIFAETKAEWMLSAQACFMRNFPGKVACSYTVMKILFKKSCKTDKGCFLEIRQVWIYLLSSGSSRAIVGVVSLET